MDMGMIHALGVGLEAGDLTMKAVQLLKSGAKVILHTERIGCAAWLKGEGIPFESLDFLYDECEDFDEHADRAADCVLQAAADSDVV